MKLLLSLLMTLDLWVMRRRMRKMGFRDAAERTSPEILIRLEKAERHRSGQSHFRWKIILITLGLLLGLISVYCLYRELIQPAPRVIPHFELVPGPHPKTLNRYVA